MAMGVLARRMSKGIVMLTVVEPCTEKSHVESDASQLLKGMLPLNIHSLAIVRIFSDMYGWAGHAVEQKLPMAVNPMVMTLAMGLQTAVPEVPLLMYRLGLLTSSSMRVLTFLLWFDICRL